MLLKSYRFDKYKTKIKKNSNIKLLKILDEKNIFNKSEKDKFEKGNSVKRVFLTRDLVSEPANILFPEKFVDVCKVLKKAGITIEVFDEKN